jgi:PAS domain S-box-containing protein
LVACGLWELSRQNPALVDEFFDHAPDALVVVNDTGRIECVSAQVEILFRLPRERLLGQPIEILLPERLRQQHLAHRLNYMRHPNARVMGAGLALLARRADGSEFPVEIVLSPVEIERRQMVLVVVRDISERKLLEQQRDVVEEELRVAVERYRELSLNLEQRVEERSRELNETNRQLREANKVFSAIYERGGIFIGNLDLEGIVVDANPACVESLGFARADIIGKPLWKAGWFRTLPEDRESIRKRLELALAGEQSRAEARYLTGNGEERVADVAMTPIKVDGRVVSVFTAGVDVTERARQYQATFENATVGIVHAANDLRWGRVNDAMGRIVGYSANELFNKPVLDIMHPDYREAALADVGRLRDRKADSYIAERQYLRKDGTTVWVRAYVGALRNGDGSIAHFVGVIQDISGRKRAEELQRRQADLLDQSHDAIFTWKIGGGIAYWNRGAEVLYGYTRQEAIGWRSHDLLRTRAPISMKIVEAAIARRGSWDGELIHTTRDGREIVVESRIVRVSYDGEIFALETNRDVTERKHAEQELRKSEERFRSSIIQSPVPTILYDDREQILAVSRSWLEAAGGISAEELHRIEDWTTIAYGERSDEIMELGRREILATKPEARVHELTIHTRGGDKRLWKFVSSCLGTKSDGRYLFVSVAQDLTQLKLFARKNE